MRELNEERGPIDLALVLHCGEVPPDFEAQSPVETVVFGKGTHATLPNISVVEANGVLPHSSGLLIAHFIYEGGQFAVTEVPDILLTDSWPSGFHTHLPAPPTLPTCLSPQVAAVARTLSPRFHFAAGAETWYCRPQYRSPSGWGTCFVGLAAVTADAPRSQVAYFLDIQGFEKTPKSALMSLAPDATECPYAEVRREEHTLVVEGLPKHASKGQVYRYFAAFGTVLEVTLVKDRRRTARLTVPASDSAVIIRSTNGSQWDSHELSVSMVSAQRSVKGPQEECWFCLASPKAEEHLVVAVYEHWYLAAAKGPIAESHCLVVPIAHVNSRAELSPEAREELDFLLHKQLKAQLGAYLSFENGREASVPLAHFYISVVQVEPPQVAWLVPRFSEPLVLKSYRFSPALAPPQTAQYTLLSLSNGEAELHQVLKDRNEGRDIARAAVCVLIEKEALRDWRSCHDPAGEPAQVAALRRLFLSSVGTH